MQRVLESARRCWKVGVALIDYKALSVPGGSPTFSLPIFMIPVTQLPHHTPVVSILPAPLSLEPVTGHTHLTSENSQHFHRKQGFKGFHFTHTDRNGCGYLVAAATYSASLCYKRKGISKQLR